MFRSLSTFKCTTFRRMKLSLGGLSNGVIENNGTSVRGFFLPGFFLVRGLDWVRIGAWRLRGYPPHQAGSSCGRPCILPAYVHTMCVWPVCIRSWRVGVVNCIVNYAVRIVPAIQFRPAMRMRTLVWRRVTTIVQLSNKLQSIDDWHAWIMWHRSCIIYM